MYEEQFSKRLAELRTKKGVSARDMSLSIGQNPGYIRAIECGTTFPTMSNFFYICEYLNVTPQEFFNFSEEPSNGMNALTDQLQQFDSEQINALAILRSIISISVWESDLSLVLLWSHALSLYLRYAIPSGTFPKRVFCGCWRMFFSLLTKTKR